MNAAENKIVNFAHKIKADDSLLINNQERLTSDHLTSLHNGCLQSHVPLGAESDPSVTL
jgi:hypothetical protein